MTIIKKAQKLKDELMDCKKCDFIYNKCEKHTKEAREILEEAKEEKDIEMIRRGLNIK